MTAEEHIIAWIESSKPHYDRLLALHSNRNSPIWNDDAKAESAVRLGHDAWSCDLRRSEDGSNRHIIGDAREIVHWGWDLLIVAHPPCTRLCNSGVRWLDDPSKMKNLGEDFTDAERVAWPSMDFEAKRALMWQKLDAGAALFSDLWNAPVKRVAVENPVMHKHAKARIRNYQEFAQSVQPWQFGDWERKRTCFWLRGLPNLKPVYTSEGNSRWGNDKKFLSFCVDPMQVMSDAVAPWLESESK